MSCYAHQLRYCANYLCCCATPGGTPDRQTVFVAIPCVWVRECYIVYLHVSTCPSVYAPVCALGMCALDFRTSFPKLSGSELQTWYTASPMNGTGVLIFRQPFCILRPMRSQKSLNPFWIFSPKLISLRTSNLVQSIFLILMTLRKPSWIVKSLRPKRSHAKRHWSLSRHFLQNYLVYQLQTRYTSFFRWDMSEPYWCTHICPGNSSHRGQ